MNQLLVKQGARWRNTALPLLSGLLLALLSSVGHAAGTTAGTDVVNSVSLDYQVSGVGQTTLTDSVSFVVDRRLSVTVTDQSLDYVSVATGEQDAVLEFDVTHDSNDDIALLLRVVDQFGVAVTPGGGAYTAPAGANAGFAIDGALEVIFDFGGADTVLTPDGNGVYTLDSATIDTDTTYRIAVRVDVSSSASNNALGTYTLVAAVAETGGAVITGDDNGNNAFGTSGATSIDDTAAQEDVFADAAAADSEDLTFDFVDNDDAGITDIASNGQHADTSSFLVLAANLSLTKTSLVLRDPINGNAVSANNSDTDSGNDPKAIPDAVVMYVVEISNAASAASASALALTDDLDSTNQGAIDFGAGVFTGDTTANLFVPDTVAGSGTDIPDSGVDFEQINIKECGSSTFTNTAYSASATSEIDVTLASACAGGETALIVYFVKIL